MRLGIVAVDVVVAVAVAAVVVVVACLHLVFEGPIQILEHSNSLQRAWMGCGFE